MLYTLRELLKEPNTTRVGEKLGLTQSAVSASLNRLRWAFQDELLVRSGRSMTPTKRAERLFGPVDEILNLIEQLVEEVRIEPEKMERRFRILSAEFLLAYLMPPLMQRLRKDAPGIVVISEANTREARARLRSGHVDLAVAPLAPFEEGMRQISHIPLYEDRLVCITSKDNESVGDGLTVDEYLSMPHAVFTTDSNKSDVLSATEHFVHDLGLKLNVVCEVNSYAVLPGALLNTDLIATVPSRILQLIPEHRDLKAVDLPFDVKPFTVSMIWNSSMDNDAEHRWFREQVADQFNVLETSSDGD